jgi:hypothetical protein
MEWTMVVFAVMIIAACTWFAWIQKDPLDKKVTTLAPGWYYVTTGKFRVKRHFDGKGWAAREDGIHIPVTDAYTDIQPVEIDL